MIAYEKIKKYYSKNFLWIPDDITHRHIRGKNVDGVWVSCDIHINSIYKLRSWILKEKIVDLYFSSSCWLDPTRIGKFDVGAGYTIAERLLIGYYVVLDFDDGEESRSHCVNAMNILDKEGDLQLHHILLTGHKGFHLVYKDYSVLPPAPKERFDAVGKRKAYILSLLNGISFDKAVLTNILSITRYPHSINSKSGRIARFLTKEELKRPYKELLESSQRVYNVGNPKQGNDDLPPSLHDTEKARTTLRANSKIFSKIAGTKDRHIGIFSYQRKTTSEALKAAEADYKNIRPYLKGRTFIASHNTTAYIISLTSYAEARINKAYKASNATNKKEKHKHILWPAHINTMLNNQTTSYESKPHSKLFSMTPGIVGKDKILYREKNGRL